MDETSNQDREAIIEFLTFYLSELYPDYSSSEFPKITEEKSQMLTDSYGDLNFNAISQWTAETIMKKIPVYEYVFEFQGSCSLTGVYDMEKI